MAIADKTGSTGDLSSVVDTTVSSSCSPTILASSNYPPPSSACTPHTSTCTQPSSTCPTQPRYQSLDKQPMHNNCDKLVTSTYIYKSDHNKQSDHVIHGDHNRQGDHHVLSDQSEYGRQLYDMMNDNLYEFHANSSSLKGLEYV